jgi:SAM-dependent methyltransferase
LTVAGPRLRICLVTDEVFGEWIASRYERLWPELFDPAVLDPAVEFLAGLAAGGSALEFGVGTGRVAMPLSQRGVRVHGIELSAAMAGQVPRGAVTVTVGDFATTRLDEQFDLVYLLRNTITNLTSQDAQVEAFRNAAAHLKPGGCFVIENYIPALQRLAPGETTRLFAATPEHVGYEEYDLAAQIAVSRHHWAIDGELTSFSSRHRYLWPAELDLMARLADLALLERWSDWERNPFTSSSTDHISTWRKPT